LNGLERRLFEENSADHSEEEGVNVDGKLELEEALDVVIDVTTPHAGFDNRVERIIHDDNISSSLADLSTGDVHAETNVGFGKSRSVVGAITSNSNNLMHVHEARHEQILVLRTRPSHDTHLGLELLESLEVLNTFLLVLLVALASMACFQITVHADQAVHCFKELGTLNADTIVVLLSLGNQ